MGNMSEEKKFNRLLCESIDEALNILGESAKKVLLYFIRQNYRIEDKNMYEDPETLIQGIKRFFGDAGGAFLESRIIEILYRRMGLISPHDQNFEDAIKNAKKLYTNKNYPNF